MIDPPFHPQTPCTDRFNGFIAAAHTPICPNGGLALDVIEKQAEHFLNTGVSGVFVAGTTGECHSLSLSERIALAERWAAVAGPTHLRVIVHVGHNCQSEARELAAHAAGLPIDAVAAMAPSFFKPQSVDALLDFLEPVASAAEGLAFYYYDIPSYTGVELSMVDFWRRGKPRIESLAGIKYTNSDLAQLQNCLQFSDGECEILFGCDEALLAGLALGVHGAVGSSYNFAMPIYSQVLDAYRMGNAEAAREIQAESAEMIHIISQYEYAAAAKSIMAMIGVDCGPVRPPLTELTPIEKIDLKTALRHLSDVLHIDVEC